MSEQIREKLRAFTTLADAWFDDLSVVVMYMPTHMASSDHDGRMYPSRNEYYQNISITRKDRPFEFMEFTVWLQDSTIDECLICLTALTIGMHLKAGDSIDAITRKGCTDGMKLEWGRHTFDFPDNTAMAW